MVIGIDRAKGSQPPESGVQRIIVAPAFPRDARILKATVQGSPETFSPKIDGDVQTVELSVPTRRLAAARGPIQVVFEYEEGTDVFTEAEAPATGARNSGIRILHSIADEKTLRLTLEGLGGMTYSLGLRTSATIGPADGVKVEGADPKRLLVSFTGQSGTYVRREIVLPLARGSQKH